MFKSNLKRKKRKHTLTLTVRFSLKKLAYQTVLCVLYPWSCDAITMYDIVKVYEMLSIDLLFQSTPCVITLFWAGGGPQCFVNLRACCISYCSS